MRLGEGYTPVVFVNADDKEVRGVVCVNTVGPRRVVPDALLMPAL